MFRPNLQEDRKIANAETIISYQFTDRLQARHALQLADSAHPDGNKHLALLGDAVIKLVLIQEGLRRQATRGQINEVLSLKSSNADLAQQGFAKGLSACVYNNQSQGNTVHQGPMASTVEAIVGAVYVDSGERITTVKVVMNTLGVSWPE
ncbi:hypothetical protein BDW74DRAFT_162681 [Aspergillus multicolor]|uniref:uncharacterized protein n=1 Tax=Aspergillus multicolor TaxID=41759 RepID=UPI003CCE38E2